MLLLLSLLLRDEDDEDEDDGNDGEAAEPKEEPRPIKHKRAPANCTAALNALPGMRKATAAGAAVGKLSEGSDFCDWKHSREAA